MRPHEETIAVGGIDVHTWVGGQGDAAAGAPRRRRQSRLDALAGAASRSATRCGRPRIPASGLGRRGVDGGHRRPRPLLSVVHRRRAARVGRTCSATRSAAGRRRRWPTMSPGAIDRLVLVAPVGLKPERARSSTSSIYSPLAASRAHGARSRRPSPSGTSCSAKPPTPAELEIAQRNREMTARLTWKPYMHNPRLAHFLPRVTTRR